MIREFELIFRRNTTPDNIMNLDEEQQMDAIEKHIQKRVRQIQGLGK